MTIRLDRTVLPAVLATCSVASALACDRSPRTATPDAGGSMPFVVEEELPFGARLFARGSDGFTVERLVLLPDGRATASLAGCVAAGPRKGRVVAGGAAVELVEHQGASDTPVVQLYHFVRWAERTYLVHDALMRDFVDAVNAGLTPDDAAWDAFLLERGDAEKPVEGLPDLPAPWDQELLSEPRESGASPAERVEPHRALTD